MHFGFRSKLIVSYAAVIFLTLLLASLLFWIVVQQIQQNERQQAEDRLSNLTNRVAHNLTQPLPFTRELENYQRQLSSIAQILNVRILVVDAQQTVDVDTELNAGQNVQGRKLSGYNLMPGDSQTHQGTFQLNGVDYLFYDQLGPCIGTNAPAASGPHYQSASLNSQANLCPPNSITSAILLAVKEDTLNTSWRNFLPGLVLAALTALVVAIIVASFIARSIARPLIQMTRASEAIAKGDYNQQLPVSPGDEDEIGRLGQSFNHMAHEVARNQQTMRDFVANVSHELKTPLTSIQGFSQALLDGTADNPAMLQHSAQVIHSEAARMRRLVEELLDLSRIEAGQVELNWREVDLKWLLERVLVKLEVQAVEKQISLQTRLTLAGANQNGGILVRGDSDRLEQIFTNLLDNAIKYAPINGQVYIKLETATGLPLTSARFGWIAVSISNTGSLIPADQMSRIFERFYKLDKSRARRRGESTGLGLAIARELVEAHHGQIQVESQPLNPITTTSSDYPANNTSAYNPVTDNLTTFRVYLPLSQAITTASQPPYTIADQREEDSRSILPR